MSAKNIPGTNYVSDGNRVVGLALWRDDEGDGNMGIIENTTE
jgi:hypothetical protein